MTKSFLLECEVVDFGTVCPKGSGRIYKVWVTPKDIFHTENLISPNSDFGVALKEDSQTSFTPQKPFVLKEIPLNKSGRKELNIVGFSIFRGLLAYRGRNVVLEIKGDKVIGFKSVL